MTRLLGRTVFITGLLSLVLAATVGTTALASTEGVARALWLVFSVAGLSGQGTPDTSTARFVLVVVTCWMAISYALAAIGSLVLWRSRGR